MTAVDGFDDRSILNWLWASSVLQVVGAHHSSLAGCLCVEESMGPSKDVAPFVLQHNTWTTQHTLIEGLMILICWHFRFIRG